eukprot:scaffold8019_cov133-Isochrysis_galbana.AAC.8
MYRHRQLESSRETETERGSRVEHRDRGYESVRRPIDIRPSQVCLSCNTAHRCGCGCGRGRKRMLCENI